MCILNFLRIECQKGRITYVTWLCNHNFDNNKETYFITIVKKHPENKIEAYILDYHIVLN